MKKTLLMILSLLLAANLGFVGYGKSDVKIVVTPQLIGNENAKMEITWQPVPAHSLTDSNQAKVEYLTRKAKEWAEKHPNVKIIPIQTTIAINDSMAKILVQAAEGRAPDVAAIDSYIFPNFAKYAQPIDDVLKAKKLRVDDWFPFAQRVTKPAGKTLGIWYTTDVRILFYRKDLVKNPPQTWAQLFTIGKQLKEQGYDAFLYSAGRDENLTMNTLPYYWGLGGELVDNSGKPVFGEGKNREAMINYFKFLKDTVDTGITPIRVLNYKSDPNMNADLASGKVAMFVGVSNMAAQLRSVIGTEKFNELWGAAPIPMAKEGIRVSAAGGWVATVFAKDNQKRKLAADFVISLYGDDSGMEGWCEAGGYLPPRKSVFEKADYFKTDLFAQKFKDELQYARVRPAASIYPAISLEFQIAINNVLTGKTTPEKAVDDAWKNVNTLNQGR